MKKGDCDKRFIPLMYSYKITATFGRWCGYFLLCKKILLLVVMVFCDLVNKSDNACEHYNELKQF